VWSDPSAPLGAKQPNLEHDRWFQARSLIRDFSEMPGIQVRAGRIPLALGAHGVIDMGFYSRHLPLLLWTGADYPFRRLFDAGCRVATWSQYCA
jgi:hypothetical protein